MVDESRAEGLVRNIGGKINQAADEARNMYGHVVNEVREFTADRTFGALLATVGLGGVADLLLACC